MIQKEVILVILIGIVIYLIYNNEQVKPIINSIPNIGRKRRELMSNDLNNDMYLMDNATMNNTNMNNTNMNNIQSDNTFMYDKSYEESENINNAMYGQTSDDNMPNSEDKLYGQALQGNMYAEDNRGNMNNNGDKLYGSLYGQALQGNMNAEDNRGNINNNEDKLYGSLYGQALQGNMNAEENERNMPADEEKLYGSQNGMHNDMHNGMHNDMQNDMNNSIPKPMDVSLDYDKPMALKMDFPIDFNKSINSSMDMSKFGENIMKEKMFNMDMNMGMMCPAVYNPVTCPNGQTYSNSCEAANAGQVSSKCKSGFPTIKEKMTNMRNMCPSDYKPVTCLNGRTYNNSCEAARRDRQVICKLVNEKRKNIIEQMDNLNEKGMVRCSGGVFGNMAEAAKYGMAKSDCENWKYGS